MSLRTITIEDDDYEELEGERDDLLEQVSRLEERQAELEAELEELSEKWEDRRELLKRIGELS